MRVLLGSTAKMGAGTNVQTLLVAVHHLDVCLLYTSEDTLNLRDSRVYDTIEEDGKEKRVLNQNETTLAQQKQQAIKDAFAGWVWKDPQRRALLVKKYNELFNSTRPREYDGSHIHFVGMNPEINLREHQRNAVAHVPVSYTHLIHVQQVINGGKVTDHHALLPTKSMACLLYTSRCV